MKGSLQVYVPYLFPQDDCSLTGKNLDFLGVCEVEGPIEASSNDPREAFGIICAEYSVELLGRQARIRQDDLPLIITIDVGNGVIHARSDKINLPSAPRKRTFNSIRFRMRANDSDIVANESGPARPKVHARTHFADLPYLNDALGDAYLGTICAEPYREGRSDSSNSDVAHFAIEGTGERKSTRMNS